MRESCLIKGKNPKTKFRVWNSEFRVRAASFISSFESAVGDVLKLPTGCLSAVLGFFSLCTNSNSKLGTQKRLVQQSPLGNATISV